MGVIDRPLQLWIVDFPARTRQNIVSRFYDFYGVLLGGCWISQYLARKCIQAKTLVFNRRVEHGASLLISTEMTCNGGLLLPIWEINKWNFILVNELLYVHSDNMKMLRNTPVVKFSSKISPNWLPECINLGQIGVGSSKYSYVCLLTLYFATVATYVRVRVWTERQRRMRS